MVSGPKLPVFMAELELGVGVGVPWSQALPLAEPKIGQVLLDWVECFLLRHARHLGHLHVCWRRGDEDWDGNRDADAYDELFARLRPHVSAQALRQTSFNLAGLHPYDRGPAIEAANAATA